MRDIVVTAIQMDVLHGREQENLEKALSMIDRAAEQGADIICLPELFTTGYDYEYIKKQANPIPNEITEKIQLKAKESGKYIIAGSLPETREEAIYNTSILVAPTGNIIGKYSKTHLFPLMEEDRYFKQGNEAKVFKTDIGNMGIMLCYDLRFPELARKLTLGGAEIIFLPAEFPYPREEHWKILLQSRAIENQVYMVGINRIGQDKKFSFFGHSLIIDPWGKIMADGGKGEGLVTAHLDLSRIDEIRRALPCLENRRSDLY